MTDFKLKQERDSQSSKCTELLGASCPGSPGGFCPGLAWGLTSSPDPPADFSYGKVVGKNPGQDK